MYDMNEIINGMCIMHIDYQLIRVLYSIVNGVEIYEHNLQR